MVRYKLDSELKNLYSEPNNFKSKIPIPYSNLFETILVDILVPEREDRMIKLKLFFPDGRILVGWSHLGTDYIDIANKDELFDGRFNSDKVC